MNHDDPQLASIRARDEQWVYDGQADTAEHDRRVLLQMVDDLMEGIEAIAHDMGLIKKVLRAQYVARTPDLQEPGNVDL